MAKMTKQLLLLKSSIKDDISTQSKDISQLHFYVTRLLKQSLSETFYGILRHLVEIVNVIR